MTSNKDTLFKDNKRKIDFVLVHEVGNDNYEKQANRQHFKELLKLEGLETEEFSLVKGSSLWQKIKNCLKKEKAGTIVFTKVHVQWKTLLKYAELLKMKFPYEENNLSKERQSQESCFETNRKKCLKPFKLDNAQLKDKKYFTAVFSRQRFDIAEKDDEEKKNDKFFTNAQRSRICFEILSFNHCAYEDNTKSEDKEKSGYYDGIRTLIDNETYTAAFPLHDGHYLTKGNDRHLLYELWTNPRKWFKYQPLDKIRNYFGEKVGIYFTWLGFYTSMLIPAAIAGVVVFFIRTSHHDAGCSQ